MVIKHTREIITAIFDLIEERVATTTTTTTIIDPKESELWYKDRLDSICKQYDVSHDKLNAIIIKVIDIKKII